MSNAILWNHMNSLGPIFVVFNFLPVRGEVISWICRRRDPLKVSFAGIDDKLQITLLEIMKSGTLLAIHNLSKVKSLADNAKIRASLKYLLILYLPLIERTLYWKN